MKKAFIIVAILLATATTITIVSCKKEKENVKSNNTENSLMNYELSEMDKAMIAFGEKLRTTSEEKSGETMPLSEALTALSNYQNFSLCDASFYSTEMTLDTFKVSLDVTNGEVSFSDLSDFFYVTKTLILSRLTSISGDSKAIYSIWSSISESTRGNLDNYTGSIDVNVVVRIREGINPGIFSQFDTTDYWYDFDSLGKCDIYAGQCVGSDCVTRLNQMLHFRRPSINIPGFRVYFTDMENYLARAINYPDVYSPNGYYAWPWRSFWDDVQCVSPSEMTYYLYAIEDDIADLESQYYNSLVEFQLHEHSYWKEPNQHHEAYLNYTIAEIHYTPLPND